MSNVDDFKKERERLNEITLRYGGQELKRFFSLDSQVYRDGAIPAKTKELLGLVASMVLRCDDCIKYHTIQCHKAGISSEEYNEAVSIALVVGGSIVIPHLRRAMATWDELVNSSR